MLIQALSLAAALIAAAGLSALGLVGGSWLEGRGALKQTLVAAASLVPLLIAMRVSHAGPGSVGLTRTNLARSAVIGGALAAGCLSHSELSTNCSALGWSIAFVWSRQCPWVQ